MTIVDILRLIGQPPKYHLTIAESAAFDHACHIGWTLEIIHDRAVALMLDIGVRDPRAQLFRDILGDPSEVPARPTTPEPDRDVSTAVALPL